MNVELTLLNPGMIADIFNPRRKGSAGKKAFHPLAIPNDPTQCVDVYYPDGDDLDLVRCDGIADRYSANGWLCESCSHSMDDAIEQRAVEQHRDRDGEVIDHILKTEFNALVNAKVERVRLTSKGLYITFLKG